MCAQRLFVLGRSIGFDCPFLDRRGEDCLIGIHGRYQYLLQTSARCAWNEGRVRSVVKEGTERMIEKRDEFKVNIFLRSGRSCFVRLLRLGVH